MQWNEISNLCSFSFHLPNLLFICHIVALNDIIFLDNLISGKIKKKMADENSNPDNLQHLKDVKKYLEENLEFYSLQDTLCRNLYDDFCRTSESKSWFSLDQFNFFLYQTIKTYYPKKKVSFYPSIFGLRVKGLILKGSAQKNVQKTIPKPKKKYRRLPMPWDFWPTNKSSPYVVWTDSDKKAYREFLREAEEEGRRERKHADW